MEKIWKFFENLDEYIYVADIDTHELVYMNKKTLETYGFHSVEEIKGKKCFEVLQRSSTPCTICNNADLELNQFKEWRYYNPVLGKHLLLKDTLVQNGKRRYRIEIAMDVSFETKQAEMLRSYQSMEAFVNEGLRIALKAATPDKSIQVMLEYLGKALQGDRTYIFEHRADDCDDNTYEWVANGVSPEKQNLQNLPPEVCKPWYDSFRDDKNIVIDDMEKVRAENPSLYRLLSQQQIHSLVVVPLYDDGKILGFYGVDNPPAKFLDDANDMLQIMGSFIVSSIRRRNLIQQLEVMSYRDQLTQLGNRFAVNRYMAGVGNEESIGVVYCDITGLKQVNDTQGHDAGDDFILNASHCLQQIYKGYGVFRIGGDELLVLCAGINQNTFFDCEKRLHEDMKKHHVTMAVGAVWEPQKKETLDELLKKAEKLMYADKENYYNKTGRIRRVQ